MEPKPSANIKEFVPQPKEPHKTKLNIHNRNWIDNYFLENINQTEQESDKDEINHTEDQEILSRELEYKLWLEAGKVQPSSKPVSNDVVYDFNIWRRFKRCFIDEANIPTENQEDKVIQDVAKMYPINVPKPSKLSENDFIKFAEASKIIRDENRRRELLRKLKAEKDNAEKLKIKSWTRNPPHNINGIMEPPEGYKNFPKYLFQTPSIPDEEESGNKIRDDINKDVDGQIDIFGRIQDKQFKPSLWKLTNDSPSKFHASKGDSNSISTHKKNLISSIKL